MDEFDFVGRKANHDFCLLVANERFYVNKGVLAEFSGVFLRMFFGETSLAFDGANDNELPIEDFDADVVKAMLVFYTGFQRATIIKDENVVSLLKIADKFEMPELMAACEKFIATHWANSRQNCLESLALAYQYKWHEMAAVVLPRCVYQTAEAFEAFEGRLPMKIVLAVLRNQQMRVFGELHYDYNKWEWEWQ